MRTCYALMAAIALLGTMAIGSGQAVAEVSITITKIEQDNLITGKVSGLAGQEANHKVVVYVKTDKWYIHPFASGGPGKAFAEIAKDGAWEIHTVRRDHPAIGVAALVVGRDYPAPATADSMGGITAKAKLILNKTDLDKAGFLDKL